MGQFILFLSTVDADPGDYVVQFSAATDASASFVLDIQSPLHVQEGGGTTLAVPAGIAVTSKMLYLPRLQR